MQRTALPFLFDLRSDILAPPSERVAAAVADAARSPAEFGWRTDPTERALEEKTCEVLGKESAALFPTCTAANIAGLIGLGAAERLVVMDEGCHLATNERAGIEWLTRRQPHLLTAGETSLPSTRADEAGAIFCLENTHNRRGGAVTSAAETAALAEPAKVNGWSVFLDGSRLWNAAVASSTSPAALALPADLVSVSFNKGLAAPNGAALAGSREVIGAAVDAWRKLGGILRPSHVVAAGALAALDEIERLAQDHAIARETARAIASIGGYGLQEPQTNIVLVSGEGLGLDGPALARSLAEHGIGALGFGPATIRLVFHRGIPPGSPDAIAAAFARVSKGLTGP